LRETEFKGDIIYLAEEILKQSSFQIIVWLWLVAFSQVYSEDQEQKTRKLLKRCYFFRKAHVQVGLRKAWFLKRLAPLKINQYFSQ
jgi:hypothetical protein